jgi:hypothetical protein
MRQDSIKKNSHYGIGYFPEAVGDSNQVEYDDADLELSLHPDRYFDKWKKIGT